MVASYTTSAMSGLLLTSQTTSYLFQRISKDGWSLTSQITSYLCRRAVEAGLVSGPPGSLVHPHDEPLEPVSVHLLLEGLAKYSPEYFEQCNVRILLYSHSSQWAELIYLNIWSNSEAVMLEVCEWNCEWAVAAIQQMQAPLSKVHMLV